MSLGTRDAEAYAIVTHRSFADASLVALDLEMQTRRLTLRVYGALQQGADTYVASIAFFGVSALAIARDEDGTFPQSARIASLDLTYDDEADEGQVTLLGSRGWTLAFGFDGLAIEETRAMIASLADDE